LFVCVCVYVRARARPRVCLFVCVCVCLYVCMYLLVCMYVCTWCCRKVIRLTTLCTNRQRCCLPLHMSVRLTSAVDSVQFWTCYNCYAIVENVWSEVMFVRCVTKMDQQKFEQSCAIIFCVRHGESTTVTYEKLHKAYGEHYLPRAQEFRWLSPF